VTLCARRDDDRIDALLEELLWTRCCGRSEWAGHLGDALVVGVGQEERHAVEPGECLSVQSADPADTDDPDAERYAH
jgi:hypothetical protein